MFFHTSDASLKIESVHILEWEKQNTLVPQKNFYDLSFREIGDAHFITGEEEEVVESGEICYFPVGFSYRIRAGKERILVVRFSADKPLSDTFLHIKPLHLARFQNEFSDLYKIWTERDPDYYFRAMSLFYKLLANIEKEYENNLASPIYNKIKPALLMMNTSFSDADLGISDLAAAIGVSETYFRRCFENHMNISPLAYLNGIRIERAKELLQSGFYGVREIAPLCGFRDSKYFSTAFRKACGVSPSAYKKTWTM